MAIAAMHAGAEDVDVETAREHFRGLLEEPLGFTTAAGGALSVADRELREAVGLSV